MLFYETENAITRLVEKRVDICFLKNKIKTTLYEKDVLHTTY